jgi:hypothetical protein
MKRGLSWRPVLAAGLAAIGLAGAAGAQERMTLQGGFSPDPSDIAVVVTGAVPAANLVRGCPGWIAEGPAVVVDFASPGVPLRFNLSQDGAGAGVAGMLIVAPDGVYRCAPMDGQGRAVVRIDPALTGQHAIWPALASAGVATGVRVFVSEFDFADASPPALPLGIDAPPAAGLHLLPEAIELAVTLAPTASAADYTAGCAGRIDPTRPDAVIRLAADRDRVELRASSTADTTLVVIGPDGAEHCNDDTYGLDPAVVMQPAAAGDYAVWVGTFDDVQGITASLRAAAGGAAIPAGLQTGATPAAGLHVLSGDGAHRAA